MSKIVTSYEPFSSKPWNSHQLEQVIAFQEWHRSLNNRSNTVKHDVLHSDINRLQSNQAPQYFDKNSWNQARASCHSIKAPEELLIRQAKASLAFTSFFQPSNFKELRLFIDDWLTTYVLLHGYVIGWKHNWQQIQLQNFAHACFYTNHLLQLSHDMELGRYYIPKEELAYANLSINSFRQFEMPKEQNRILWKWAIRARDSFGQCKSLADELPKPFARHFKKEWRLGLTILKLVEKQDFDFRKPLLISGVNQFVLELENLFGIFRKRL